MARLKGSLIATAIIFLLLGAVGGYLALSIPRDIRAEAILREARDSLQKNDREGARRKFEQVITQYPRTDSGGAAMYALFRMVDQDRNELKAQLDRQLREIQASQKSSQTRLTEVEKQTAASQVAVTVPASPPPPPPKLTIRKSGTRPAHHPTSTRKRRRRR